MRFRRHWQSAAATLAFVLLTGCAHQGTTVAEPTPTPVPTTTQDGAVPVSVLTSFHDMFRKGRGELACSFLTEQYQGDLAAQTPTTGEDSTPFAACADAVVALKRAGTTPRPVDEIIVETANETDTTLTIKRSGSPDERVGLILDNDRWVIESITPSN
jgi:hypothetical protein